MLRNQNYLISAPAQAPAPAQAQALYCHLKIGEKKLLRQYNNFTTKVHKCIEYQQKYFSVVVEIGFYLSWHPPN